MVYDDLRVGIAADELEGLVEPPGALQVDRQGQLASRRKHPVDAWIGRVL